MSEKTELKDCQLFIGEKPLLTGMLAEPAKFDEDFWSIPDDWKDEKKLSFSNSLSFDVPMTEELMKLQEELVDSFSRQYSDWLKRVEVSVRIILTEYIDDPFTTDPSKATKEEFESRHINGLVYEDMADGSQAFIGVLQGSTLICVNGMRIENFMRVE
jgi:hypothetical protein